VMLVRPMAQTPFTQVFQESLEPPLHLIFNL